MSDRPKPMHALSDLRWHQGLMIFLGSMTGFRVLGLGFRENMNCRTQGLEVRSYLGLDLGEPVSPKSKDMIHDPISAFPVFHVL